MRCLLAFLNSKNRMHLKRPDEMPQAMAESIAFAITGDRQQRHVGMVYRDHNAKTMLLHLGWHRLLRHHEWDGNYHWMELSGLDRELQETLADFAVFVADAHPGSPIPYSVIFREGRYFDANGQFINMNDGSGLTCATFLLAIFSDFGLPLIDAPGWPASRKGDFTWLRDILKKLKIHEVLRHKMPAWEWLEQVRYRHRLKRFRPEEVFATADLFIGEPLRFSDVEPAGIAVNAALPA